MFTVMMRPEVKIPTVISGALISGVLFLSSVGIAIVTAYTAKGSIEAQNAFSYLTLFDQINSTASMVGELQNINLNDFNNIAAERLFKYSDLQNLEQSKLVLKYYVKQGVTHLSQGLSGITDIHIDSQNLSLESSQPSTPDLR